MRQPYAGEALPKRDLPVRKTIDSDNFVGLSIIHMEASHCETMVVDAGGSRSDVDFDVSSRSDEP